MNWRGHIVRMGEKRNACGVEARWKEEKQDVGVWIILK
jgi:hypothetical protein